MVRGLVNLMSRFRRAPKKRETPLQDKRFAFFTGPLLKRLLSGAWVTGSLAAFLLLGPASVAPASPAFKDRHAPPGDSFRQATPGYHYRFPEDHGSHDEFRTEWWYYTGHLSTTDGRPFGFQLTFFRRGIRSEAVQSNPSRWAVRHLYLAHFAVTDIRHGRFRYAEKVSRAGLGKAGAETGTLRVWIDRWIAETASPAHDAHHLRAASDGFAVDLILDAEKPPVIHGRQGTSRKGPGPGQASHYYSLTRLATAGVLEVDGTPYRVTGTSWMDHEFGSGDLGEDQVGWDWYSLQVDGGLEVMLYVLRRRDGTPDPASSGTLVFPEGRSQHLERTDFQVAALDHWTSPESGARYPSRWWITVPRYGLAFTLSPRLPHQELITRRSTLVTYWEGAVEVTGTRLGAPLTGQGYVELTGYAERFGPRL